MTAHDAYLQVREVLNITISVLMVILCSLLLYYVASDLSQNRYSKLSWTTKLLIGMLFISVGEFLRSTTVWSVIHYEGGTANYYSAIIPLVGAQLLIPLGALCVIRNLSPNRCKHLPWVASLMLVLSLVAINYLF